MRCNYDLANFSMVTNGESDNSHDAVVLHLSAHGKFAEVLINRDANSLFRMGEGEYRIVAWVLRPIADPHNIVTCSAKSFCNPAPHAGIQQQSHEACSVVSVSGSIRSLPIWRLAYARQA